MDRARLRADAARSESLGLPAALRPIVARYPRRATVTANFYVDGGGLCIEPSETLGIRQMFDCSWNNIAVPSFADEIRAIPFEPGTQHAVNATVTFERDTEVYGSVALKATRLVIHGPASATPSWCVRTFHPRGSGALREDLDALWSESAGGLPTFEYLGQARLAQRIPAAWRVAPDEQAAGGAATGVRLMNDLYSFHSYIDGQAIAELTGATTRLSTPSPCSASPGRTS